MAEQIPAGGCTMNKKLLTECQSSGGCCERSNCRFGGCNDEVPTPAPLSKTGKHGHHKNGDVLGNIVGEDQNQHQGFGESNKMPIVRTHMPGKVNWARLWGAGKKGDDEVDNNVRVPSDPYDKQMEGGDDPTNQAGFGAAIQGFVDAIFVFQAISGAATTAVSNARSNHQENLWCLLSIRRLVLIHCRTRKLSLMLCKH